MNHGGAVGEIDGDLGGALAQFAGILPDRDGLRAAGDAVERGEVGILAGDRYGAGQTLGLQSRHGAAGGAVIRGDDRVDLVVVGSQDLFHVLLGVGGQPAVRIGLADILDLAGIDGFLEHFHLAREQEVGVRIGRGALDEGVIAFRLGLLDFARLDAADFLVVEGQVEGVRVLDQAVIADHRNAVVDGGLHGRADGGGILRQDDQRIGALRDQRLHVGELLGGRRLGVRRNVGGAGGLEGLLDGRLVGLPALFLEVGPGHADGLAVLRGGRSGGSHREHRASQRELQKLHDFPPGAMAPAFRSPAHIPAVETFSKPRKKS